MLQADPCSAAANAAEERGNRMAFELDLEVATAAYAEAGRLGCEDAATIAVYLEALRIARDAYRSGGSESSLAPVRAAITTLDNRTARGSQTAEIARTLLQAAVAAAQSERGDMGTLLTHALHLEDIQRAIAGKARLPVTAMEVAGDLWLQVHRFDEARAAYRTAREILGRKPRIEAGLARAAARLGDASGACAGYRELLALLKAGGAAPAERQTERPEVQEARQYLKEHTCR